MMGLPAFGGDPWGGGIKPQKPALRAYFFISEKIIMQACDFP
jgi:hypothetical protein